MNDLYIKESDIDGLGCYTRRDIKKGEQLTFSVLPIQRNAINHHKFPYDDHHSCIILSEFTYCNHSKTPNVEPCSIDYKNQEITFKCIKDIEAYSEITFDYGTEISNEF